MYYTFYKKHGDSILIRYKNPETKETVSKVFKGYKPTLYIKSEEETEWKSIFGHSLSPKRFDSMKLAKEYAESMKHVDGYEIEGNSDYANQFIIELMKGQEPQYEDSDIRTGVLDIEVDTGSRYHLDTLIPYMEHEEDEVKHVKVLDILLGGIKDFWLVKDPEVDEWVELKESSIMRELNTFPHPYEAQWPITAITIHDNFTDTFYVYGLEHSGQTFDIKKCSSKFLENAKVEYKGFTDEKELLKTFFAEFTEFGFDLTSGWNSQRFDMPYIWVRSTELLGKTIPTKALSPFGIVNEKTKKNRFGAQDFVIECVGLPHLDYMEVYQKHILEPSESYTLNYISYVVLGEKKLSYEEHKSLQGLYKHDFCKYIEYNIKDVHLIREIDKVENLFSLTYAMAYYALANYEDTLGTVKIWEMLIAKFLYNTGRVPLFRQKFTNEYSIEGGFVKEPIKGLMEALIAYDLNSLYPHLEMQYNIGPETVVLQKDLPVELRGWKEKYTFDDLLNRRIDLSVLKKYDLSMTANFEFYRKDKMSFFSEIKRDLYAKRKATKKDMIDDKKILQEIKKEKERRGLK